MRLRAMVSAVSTASGKTPRPASTVGAKKKLSYLEAREYSSIEQDIAQADAVLAQKQAATEDLAIATDAERLQQALAELAEASERVDALYHRWTELEDKMRG